MAAGGSAHELHQLNGDLSRQQLVLNMEQDHAEQEHQAILDAEQQQLVQAHHALLEARAAQEGNARLAADYQHAEANLRDFEARAEAEINRAVLNQRQARADAARQGHANAAADAAAARRSALRTEQLVREEAKQTQLKYLHEVENQAREWKEQQNLLNQIAVQQSAQEQLKAKLKQTTDEAEAKDAQGCQIRPCVKPAEGGERCPRGGRQPAGISRREREAQAEWEARFLNEHQGFISAHGVGPHRVVNRLHGPEAVPLLPFADCAGADGGPPPTASVVTTAPTRTAVQQTQRNGAVAQPGGQARSSDQPYTRCYSCYDPGKHKCAQCPNDCCDRHFDATLKRCINCKADKARDHREAEAKREAEEREEKRYQKMLAEMEEMGRKVRVEAEEAAQLKVGEAEAAARLKVEEAERVAVAEKESAAAFAEE